MSYRLLVTTILTSRAVISGILGFHAREKSQVKIAMFEAGFWLNDKTIYHEILTGCFFQAYLSAHT